MGRRPSLRERIESIPGPRVFFFVLGVFYRANTRFTRLILCGVGGVRRSCYGDVLAQSGRARGSLEHGDDCTVPGLLS